MNRIFFRKFALLLSICSLLMTFGCQHDPPEPPSVSNCISATGDMTAIAYNPTPATLAIPSTFPPMVPAPDNPLTVEGIQLGRKLFYDPILSVDSTMSCFSCHMQTGNFTDNLDVSEGVDQIAGSRSAMPLLNLAFNHNGFFWDGRSNTLEEQSEIPVEDEIELHNTWDEVICRLTVHDDYPTYFREAFGIEDKAEITKEMAAKAIAQFERSIISGNSKYDRFLRNELFLDDDELAGHDMYFDLAPNKIRFPDVECGHCHGGPLLTTNEFLNNGIQEAATLQDFNDLGLGGITGIPADNGKFRVPTLRNIEHSAPYMHGGQFETLEEVIDHYSSGGKSSPNKDVLIYQINLDSIQKTEILAFLKTFTDTSFLNNQEFSNPF